jgi:hypothetical protein
MTGNDRKETPVTESSQQPREAWTEVGRRFEELGRALRSHFERESAPAAEGAAGAEAPGEQPDVSADRDRAAMRDALRKLSQAAQRLGENAGEAVRDPAVRESAQRAARTFGDALETTFSELGDEIRERVRARRGSDAAGPGAEPQQVTPPKEIGRSEQDGATSPSDPGKEPPPGS